MRNNKWMAALLLTTLSFTAGCAADSSAAQGTAASSTSADRVFGASAATRAATGIAYYAFDASGNGKAFGENGAVIATFDASSEARNSVLRVGAYDRHVDIVYAIVAAGSGGIQGTVDGTPFTISFAKSGPSGNAPQNVDPAFDAIFRGLVSDSQASDPGSRPHIVKDMPAGYCGGLDDAITGASAAGEWLASYLLYRQWQALCDR